MSAMAAAMATSFTPSCLRSHAGSYHRTYAAAYVQCRAQPSQDGSLILDNESSLHNVVHLPQQIEQLKKPDSHLRTGDARHDELPEKSNFLQAKEDCYDGVVVDPCSLPTNTNDFVDRLRSSLLHWKIQRKRGVWLQLPSHLVDFVPLAVKEGFKFHHAESSYIMMTYWIPDSPSTLPPNASHQVGINAFVMNDNKEVLAVQEKNGPLRGLGIWKMPTGFINQGEDLCCGAVREVKEETGIETEFVQVVSFRLRHHVHFSKSDLCFTCALRPLSFGIVLEDGELEAAKWMPLEEFQRQAFFTDNSARREMLDLCVASFNGTYTGFKARKLHSSSLSQPTQYLFHG